MQLNKLTRSPTVFWTQKPIVLPKVDSTQGSEAQCTVLEDELSLDLSSKPSLWHRRSPHAVAIEGASPLMPLAVVRLVGRMVVCANGKGRTNAS